MSQEVRPTKRRNKAQPKPKERTVQREIVSGLRQCGLAVVAIPNGGQYVGDATARIRMAIAKRMDGEVAGFPDLLIMSKRGPSKFGLLEVKRVGADLNTDHHQRQLDCHAAIAADGHNVAEVNSFDQALEAVKSWGML